MVYIEVKRTGCEFHDSTATRSTCSVRVEPLCAVGAVVAYDEAAHVPTAVTVAVTVTVTAPPLSVPPLPEFSVPVGIGKVVAAAAPDWVVAGTSMAVVGVTIVSVFEPCEPEPATVPPADVVETPGTATVPVGRLVVTVVVAFTVVVRDNVEPEPLLPELVPLLLPENILLTSGS
jgi:hypothetical protein